MILPKPKALIFDFDGTIADSEALTINLFLKMISKYSQKIFTYEDVQNFRSKSSREVFSELEIPFWKVPFAIREARLQIADRADEIPPISGIIDVLKELKTEFRMYILTSNHKLAVEKFLQKNKITGFDSISCGSSIFGKSKSMRKMLKRQNLKPQEVVYLGDETRDIDACRELDIRVIAVGWGFNRPEILKNHKPNYFVGSPEELKNLLLNSDDLPKVKMPVTT